MYVVLFTLSMLSSWVLRDYARPLIKELPWIKIHHAATGKDPTAAWCGEQAVLRVSMAQFVFFLALAALTVGVRHANDGRNAVHLKGWWLKLILWVGLIFGSFFLPEGAVNGYRYVAKAGSAIFLLVQVLILLDFAYEWNENWVARDEDRWFAALFAASASCYVGVIVLAGLSFAYFSHCSINVFFITISLLIVLVITMASLHPRAHNGSLLPAAVISLYCMYLCFSAMTSEPDTCNGMPGASTSETFLAAGLAVTLLSVVYSALRAGSSTVMSTEGSSDAKADEYEALQHSDKGGRSSTGADDSDDEEELGAIGERREDADDEDDPMDIKQVPYNYSFFHLIFACAACYYAMLLTDWGDLTHHQDKDTINVGWASVWVKVICEWVTAGIFLWTLVAPSVVQGREF